MSDASLKTLPEFEAPPVSGKALLDFTLMDAFSDDAAVLPSSMVDDLNSALREPLQAPAPPDPIPDAAPAPEPEEITVEALDDAADTEEPIETASADVTEPAVDLVPEVDLTALEDELRTLVDRCEQALEQAKSTMTQRMEMVLTECVQQLFPMLGREFLADEIVRHLPNLVPETMFGVEILASSKLAERLESYFAEDTKLPANAIIRPSDRQPEMRISVNWGEGGYDYQFEQLLTRCQQRLASSQPV